MVMITYYLISLTKNELHHDHQEDEKSSLIIMTIMSSFVVVTVNVVAVLLSGQFSGMRSGSVIFFTRKLACSKERELVFPLNGVQV